TTGGSISDIDGVLQLNDNVDITGTLSDSNSNLILDDTVDIGSATTGINVTTNGVISDIDGNLSLNDNTDVTGNFTVSGRTTLGSSILGDGKLTVTGAEVGKALVILNETGDQNILTASASGTTVANLDRSGNLSVEGSLS